MITIRNTSGKYTWIDARDINRDDITVLSEEYAISSELLADILDQDEQSRMEKEDDYLAFIVRIPKDEEDEDNPLTRNAVPLGIVLYPDKVITVCQADSVVLEDFARSRFRQYPVDTKEGFVLSIRVSASILWIRKKASFSRFSDALHLFSSGY